MRPHQQSSVTSGSASSQVTSLCTVTTLPGLEPVLVREVESLDLHVATVGTRAVTFPAHPIDVYRCLFHLRTAVRVFVHIASFEANNPDQLYAQALEIPWNRFLERGRTFAVDCTSSSGLFRHSGYAALRVKDAIADQFRRRTGSRPSVQPDRPDVRFHLHIEGSRCTISRDASGWSLHKRGYRVQAGEAPLTETLAAGLLLLSGWTPGVLLVDPFCGSGTIVIEAALMSAGIAPGEVRSRHGLRYGCESWPDFNPGIWKNVVGGGEHHVRVHGSCIGLDIDPAVLAIAKENAIRAGVADIVTFEQADARVLDQRIVQDVAKEAVAATDHPAVGYIVTNPPYGERLSESDLGSLYRAFGDTLKHSFPGFHAWILSGSFPALKQVGLRSARRIPLMNGPIECRFVHYELRQAAGVPDGDGVG